MSNETDKPLAGALRAANELNGAMMTAFYVNPQRAGSIIARESGMAELVEAVEAATAEEFKSHRLNGQAVMMRLDDWNRIVAAARRVREG